MANSNGHIQHKDIQHCANLDYYVSGKSLYKSKSKINLKLRFSGCLCDLGYTNFLSHFTLEDTYIEDFLKRDRDILFI